MAEFFDHITEKHQAFIAAQPMFFIATACAEGRVNLSPKGMGCFRVTGPNQFIYLDHTGSGNETAAHIKHNGRVTVMFNSYSRNPLILRLYGQGRVVRPDHPDFKDLMEGFEDCAGIRQIITVQVDSVQTSCGYAVPMMELVGERDTLIRHNDRKGRAEILDYQQKKNVTSIDGFDTGLNDPV